MKIGIITQPLGINYGGLLQNYALQKVLSKFGHQVYTINRNNIGIYSRRSDILIKFYIKQFIKKYLNIPYSPTYSGFKYIRQLCTKFVDEHISKTEMFRNQRELRDIIKKYNFEAYIVGSDQVWRPCYSENIYNDFLDFCQDIKGIKRIAYAASFGVREWELNEEQTKECKRLANLFNAISVREDSGVELCKKHFGINATHLLDPTLLLQKEEYIELVESNNEPKIQGDIFCYILDTNPHIEEAIKNIEHKLSLDSFQVKPKNSNHSLRIGDRINDHVIPSPIKWIRAFMDAEMVFTDSFHGCVFSIIFNKPFWVIGNKERGNARFDSLLNLFNLTDRRINIEDINNTNLNATIDWDNVNRIKEEWQKKSFEFIKHNL